LLACARRLLDDGAFVAADAAYRRLLDRNPAHPGALSGRAEAFPAFARDVEALCDLAFACSEQSLYDSAARCYGRARALDPDSRDAVWGHADCSVSVGDNATAIEAYRRYLELEPGEPEALHMLAALGEGPSPQRAADAYISDYFDRFAPDFDRKLVDELSYSVPEHMLAALAPLLGEVRGQLSILDLGCGTGLTGRLFRGYAERLDGVDLSPAMLERARERGIYDGLSEAEIGRYLAETVRRYDLIVAGDVLEYFGALADIFAGAVRALQPAGLFAFSVEASHIREYRLTSSGRYVHGRPYIARAAADAGLREVAVVREQIRLEYAEPVEGDIWVLERTV
jgi:predicted TPR repeat methyltransferase